MTTREPKNPTKLDLWREKINGDITAIKTLLTGVICVNISVLIVRFYG
jgi:hypothetical protein